MTTATLTKLEKKVPGMAVVFRDSEREALLARVDAIARSGFFLWGDQQEEFQTRFKDLTQRKHALVFSSTTSAWEYVIRYLRKLTPAHPMTICFAANAFPSMVFAARRNKAGVMFADLDELTAAVSIESIAKAWTQTQFDVLVVQHTGGLISPEWPAIVSWCNARGVVVVEDSSQAAGSSLEDGTVAGQLGLVSFFSTSATKCLHTGQGSVLVTDDDDLAKHMEQMRQYGRTQMFQAGEFVLEGGNVSQSEMNAAVGNVMLDTMVERRIERQLFADLYMERLRGVLTFVNPKATVPNQYKLMALLPETLDRTAFKKLLLEEGNVQMGSEVYDWLTPDLKVFGGEYDWLDLPCATHWRQQHVCLPMHNVLTAEIVDAAASRIRLAVDAMYD